MKILYGVQATGNGHITRARALGPALEKLGLQVHFLFSGREPEKLFDMTPFGDYSCYEGLTFVTNKGTIRPLATAIQSHPFKLVRDIRNLEIQQYDLILTDYEPITAWAGRLAGRRVVGIGHQYAFHHKIPMAKTGWLNRLIMHHFAPADIGVGLHWHHFNQPILPPMAPLDTRLEPTARIKNQILVYLPFESIEAIQQLLMHFPEYHFHIFHPNAEDRQIGHMHWHPTSRTGFHKLLNLCSGVVCNAGFELVSEVLQLGMKILVKPIKGQPEQESNALALTMLNLGQSMSTLDQGYMAEWLREGKAAHVIYPDVASDLAAWIQQGAPDTLDGVRQRLWDQTEFRLLTSQSQTSAMQITKGGTHAKASL